MIIKGVKFPDLWMRFVVIEGYTDTLFRDFWAYFFAFWRNYRYDFEKFSRFMGDTFGFWMAQARIMEIWESPRGMITCFRAITK